MTRFIKDRGSTVKGLHNKGLKLPAGTTAQRPAVAIAGVIRFNTSTTVLEIYNGSEFVTLAKTIAGYLDKSISNSITAGSTQTQAGATALTANINRVTVSGTNGDGVALPTAAAGREILIINDDSTQTIHIWPGSSFSDVIDGGSADAVDGNALAAGASRRYIAVDSTNWYTA